MFRKLRRSKQKLSDQEVLELLESEKRGVLSMIGENGYPYGIPLDFYYNKNTNKIYFHGAKEGHKIDSIKINNKACFTFYNQGEQRDGDWSYYVKSVIAFGHINIVDGIDQLKELGLKYYPSQEEVEEEIKKAGPRVQMLEFTIEHITGKTVHEK
ncbi:pyridoxamine 5'-phosphate oxidase family protein [Eggerthia catenaformis]|uniref:pyridoxamine 5'-phosphate oxidase family protein n=1 Tax=Eggerthia catenaformis TaxID=31973 RepID=UPI0028ED4BA2|nr:pyridoxamine 5'-phosphate oxidase family protein [Eggerthia catenaformis]